jgi:hypothetical protein
VIKMRALVLSLLFGVSSIICSGCAQAQNQHSSLAGRVFVYATPCGPREALTSTVTIRVERKGETVAEVVARAPRYRAEISLRPGKYTLISSRNIAHNVAVMSGKLSEVTLTIPCI